MFEIALMMAMAITQEIRTWTDKSGQFSVEAEFVGLAENKSVEIKTKDGRSLKVPLEKFSEADQDYVRSQYYAQPNRPGIGIPKLATLDAWKKISRGKFPLPRTDGVVVIEMLPEGPAKKAGLANTDIIYLIDDNPIKDTDDLMWVLQTGKEHKVSIYRVDMEAVLKADSTKQKVGADKIWHKLTLTLKPERAEELIANAQKMPPLQFVAAMTKNLIDTPEVTMLVKNTSDKDIIAFTADVYCFNRFGDPVADMSDNKSAFIYQEVLPSNESARLTATLHLHDTTALAKIYLKRIKYKDGSEWNSEDADGIFVAEAKKVE